MLHGHRGSIRNDTTDKSKEFHSQIVENMSLNLYKNVSTLLTRFIKELMDIIIHVLDISFPDSRKNIN